MPSILRKLSAEMPAGQRKQWQRHIGNRQRERLRRQLLKSALKGSPGMSLIVSSGIRHLAKPLEDGRYETRCNLLLPKELVKTEDNPSKTLCDDCVVPPMEPK